MHGLLTILVKRLDTLKFVIPQVSAVKDANSIVSSFRTGDLKILTIKIHVNW